MKVASFLLIPYKYGLGNFLSMIRKVFIKSYNTGARIHVPRQCEACLIMEPFFGYDVSILCSLDTSRLW